MSADLHKQAAAVAALDLLPFDCILGVGTGSTVNYFINQLSAHKAKLSSVVASSDASAQLLEQNGIATTPLNSAGSLDLYVDGADEVDDNRQMIKGGGGAHTREKILAHCARRFVAIVDQSKKVSRLGRFPLAVETLPFARATVARQLSALGGIVAWREGFVTDSGNWILDVRELDLTAAADMERKLKQIPGVVESGIFAIRRADEVIIGTDAGVEYCKR